jgi:anti-sigma B factor antagonist
MVDAYKPNTAVTQGSDPMGQVRTRADVRKISDLAAVIDVRGDVTAASEPVLMSAYEKAVAQGAGRLVLNLGGLEYMNSGGIGILVTLLIRANRQHKKLAAYGLSDHYREIFELTRLDEAITIYGSEQTALTGTAS